MLQIYVAVHLENVTNLRLHLIYILEAGFQIKLLNVSQCIVLPTFQCSVENEIPNKQKHHQICTSGASNNFIC